MTDNGSGTAPAKSGGGVKLRRRFFAEEGVKKVHKILHNFSGWIKWMQVR